MQSFRENRQCSDNSGLRRESVRDEEIPLATFSRIGSMIDQEEAGICTVKLDYRGAKTFVRALVVSSIGRIPLTLDS